MVLQIFLLFIVIIISLIFKFYILKTELFKENIEEGLDGLSTNVQINPTSLEITDNKVPNATVTDINPIFKKINFYKENIDEMNGKENILDQEFDNGTKMLNGLYIDGDNVKTDITSWIDQITREKSLLQQLETDESKLVELEKKNIKDGILWNSQAANEYNSRNILTFENLVPTLSDDVYDYYVFLNGYTIFKCTTAGGSATVDVFILGGGGAGGGNHGGGGGAGVPIVTKLQFQEGFSYTVNVGAGGIGGGKTKYNSDQNNGKSSEIWGNGQLIVRAYGGFYGGGGHSARAFNIDGSAQYGGSGGGGMAYNYNSGDQLIVTGGKMGQNGSNSYGGSKYNGGNGAMINGTAGNGGGGGGSKGMGGNATNQNGGNGGPGLSSPYIPDWLTSISDYMKRANNDWNNATKNGRVIAAGGGGGAWAQFLSSPGKGGDGGGGDGGGCVGNYGQPGCPDPNGSANLPVKLDNLHYVCDKKFYTPLCKNRKGSCGRAFVNIVKFDQPNKYRCTNPGGPYLRLKKCPRGTTLEPTEKTQCMSKSNTNIEGTVGKNGVVNTGSGGGGGSSTGFAGGSGGSGIVVFRANKQGSSSYNLTPVLHLPLSNSFDYTGKSNGSAKIYGSVSFTSKDNKSAAFFNNRLSNFITVPFINPSSFTFCYWVYVNDRNYYTAVSLCGLNFGNINNPCIQCDFGEPTVVFVAALPGRWTGVTNNSQPFVNKWTHVAYIVNQDNYSMQLYVNGKSAGSSTGRNRLGNNKSVFVIGRSGDNGRAFNGFISDFYYFDKVLSSSEINKIYNGGKMSVDNSNKSLVSCKGSFGQTIIGADHTCPSSQPACVGFVEGQAWGKCQTTNEDMSAVKQCARSYNFTGDNSKDARCPSFQPVCKGHITGTQWGQCYSQSNA